MSLSFVSSRVGRLLATRNNFGHNYPCRSFHQTFAFNERIVEVVPELGESITEGSIGSWAKEEGLLFYLTFT